MMFEDSCDVRAVFVEWKMTRMLQKFALDDARNKPKF